MEEQGKQCKKTLAGEYELMKQDRQPYLDKAREAAKYTIPSLIADDTQKLKNIKQIATPNQSVGADGVNNLSSKVTMTMLPPNQIFFKFAMDDMVIKEQAGDNSSQYKADVNKGLSKVEKMLLDYQEQLGDRVCLGEALKHLYIAGNIFLVHDPKEGLKYYPLDRFCVKRDYCGNVLKAITEETVGLAHNEITINVDPFLVSDILIHELDVKLQEYDDRAEIVNEMAKALANTEDKQLLQVGVLAARAGGTVKGRAGGSVLKSGANVKTDAATLAAAIYTAGVELDEKNVDEADRYCFVRPLQYAMLAQYEDIKNHDIGTGSYSDGTTGKLNNIKIIKTNHLPQENIAQTSDATKPNNVYYGDFSKTAALVMNRQAIGTVSRQGLIVEPKWILERLSHLLTARILQGHGILRPECAVEISADVEALEEDSDGDATE